MNCQKAEECLSDYMESALPSAEMKQVSMHLVECSKCSALLDAMRITVSVFRDCPDLEPGDRLLDNILVRTAGHSRSMPFFERFKRFFVQPLLAPRFAVGTGLTVLFFLLLVNFLIPAISGDSPAVSQSRIYTFMDQGLQRIYSQGLRVYDKKNEWQAQLTFLADNMLDKLQYMIDSYDIPVEGGNAPVSPDQKDENTTRGKDRRPGLMPVCLSVGAGGNGNNRMYCIRPLIKSSEDVSIPGNRG